jgi:hypothetical protein
LHQFGLVAKQVEGLLQVQRPVPQRQGPLVQAANLHNQR